MIEFAFSPVTDVARPMARMADNIQTLFLQGSSPAQSMPESSPSFLPESQRSGPGKSRKQRSASARLFPVPNLTSTDLMSSPSTTALAADMSQNFHIDKTPSIPTPRRALFPMPNVQRPKPAVLPSSSPYMPMDEDSSPLPHKLPANTTALSASTMSQVAFSSSKTTVTTSVNPKPLAPARMKTLSNASLMMNSKPALSWNQSQSPLPSSSRLADDSDSPMDGSSADDSLSSLFAASPVPARLGAKSKSSSSIVQPCKFGGMRDSFETPRPGFMRHSKIRRTHSMFQHPEEILSEEINEEKETVSMMASPSCDDDNQSFLTNPDCAIQSFPVKEDQFRRIHRDTLCEILDGKHQGTYDRFIIIDCRFEYEYEGGHIDGAININSKQRLEDELLTKVSERKPNEKLLLIFHCEYSAHRGPLMAMHLRNRDRQLNMRRYPLLHYPDIVILQGGYSHFFKDSYDRCVPQRYVEMNDSLHRHTCEREMDRFRKNMKFCRTQTFTYGSQLSNTPCGVTKSSDIRDSFRFPLREQSVNSTTPTGPNKQGKRTGLLRFSSFNDSVPRLHLK